MLSNASMSTRHGGRPALTQEPLLGTAQRPHSATARTGDKARHTTQSPQTGTHPTGAHKTGAATSSPSFLCTICWQPQYGPASKPRLLGASSRIVCEPCWRAVLDLSICWVCGECIVRGEEVVSLGWCFWHAACFGCLMCGYKIRIEDWVDGEDRPENEAVGVELARIPLCAWCDDEVAGQSQVDVLRRGLDTVSKFDGGLSRSRLDMLSREHGMSFGLSEEKLLLGKARGSARGEGAEGSQKQDVASRYAEEGLSSGSKLPCSGGKEDADSSSVYLSIYNPTGPGFRPSKTKPLPKWMSLLPSNKPRNPSLQTPHPLLNETLGPKDGTRPSERAPAARFPVHPPSPPINIPMEKQASGFRISGGEPPHREYSRSSTTDSVYLTPPEHPPPQLSTWARQPFQNVIHPPINHADSSSAFHQGSLGPVAAQLVRGQSTRAREMAAPLGSEILERHRLRAPTRNDGSSHPTPSLVERLKSRKLEAGPSGEAKGQEQRDDSGKSDLQRELRRLFREER